MVVEWEARCGTVSHVREDLAPREGAETEIGEGRAGEGRGRSGRVEGGGWVITEM